MSDKITTEQHQMEKNKEKDTRLKANKKKKKGGGEAESDGHRKESKQAQGGEGTRAALSSFIPRSPLARKVSFTSSVTAYT